MSLFDNESWGSTEVAIRKLTELNLSYNDFNAVPMCLACLSPTLSKLNLSHNNLSQIGHLSCYPVGLKSLDLSYNHIMGHILFDGPRRMVLGIFGGAIEFVSSQMPGYEGWYNR